MFSKTALETRKKGWDKLIKTMEINGNNGKIEDAKTPSELVEEIEKITFNCLQEIKIILFKRNESRILQDGKFKYWSQKLFAVFLKIRNNISLDELKKHNRQVLKGNLPEIKKKMQKYKSDLGRKLILREASNSKPDSNLNLEIRNEWERLLKVMSLENLVVYSLNVLKQNRLQKSQTEISSPSQKSKQLTCTASLVAHSTTKKDKSLLRVEEQKERNGRTNQDFSTLYGQSTRKKDKLGVMKQNKNKPKQNLSGVGTRRTTWIVEDIGQRLSTKNKKSTLVVEEKEEELKQSKDFSNKETQHFQCARIKKRVNTSKHIDT